MVRKQTNMIRKVNIRRTDWRRVMERTLEGLRRDLANAKGTCRLDLAKAVTHLETVLGKQER